MSKFTHRLAALCITAAVVFTGLAAQAERALPKGYQRVQFVELTDGAVVQTDVHVEETMSLYFKFAMNYKSAYGAAITDYLGENNRLTCVRYNSTTKTTYLVSFMNKTNGGGTSMKLTTADGQIIEGKMSAGTASINNVTATLKATSYGTPLENTNCLLLKDTGAGSTFYYFTVSNTVTDVESGESTTTLVRDYIPCVQLATGKAGFWDGDEFQTSETGTVTAGDYVIDPATDYVVSGYPAEYATDETPVFYGVIAGLAGETYTAPATMPFNNGTRTCTGYKLYEYQDGAYVEIASDSATTYTFTAADAAASNRKLVWQWQTAETYTASSYAAADVLVSQWDGFDNQGTGTHDPSATDWKALKGGVNFALTGTAWTENGLSFSGDAESYALALSTAEGFAEAFPSGAKTVEIVVNPKTLAGYALCGSMCGLYFDGTTSVTPTMSAAKSMSYYAGVANATETFSTQYNGSNQSSALCRNGVASGIRGSYTRSVSPTDVSLGGNGAGGFNGTIHSLRIYSRALTESEAAYNAAVDRIRFQGADPTTEIDALGIRLRQDGLFEYLLSVAAGSDGKVKVTANGETTAESVSAELWLTNGAPVKVEFVPTTAGDWHYLEGCPDDVAYVSPTVTTFTMPAKKWSVEEIPFAYQDDNIVACDGSVRATNTYEGRTVYIFTNTTFKNAPVFLKRAARLDDLLVVAGGGGGVACSATAQGGGGGGGGVIYQSADAALAHGSCLRVAVGAGGVTGAIGGNSVLTMGATTLTAVGGGIGSNTRAGAGANGTAGQGCSGGASLDKAAGGGGGGAEEIGGSYRIFGSTYAGGIGGTGRWDAITGENHCYGSGGGGFVASGKWTFDEGAGLPIFGEGGADSGGRGGIGGAISGVKWDNEWFNGHDGVDGLGGGGGPGLNSKTIGRGGSGTVILGFTAFNDSRTLEVDDIDTYPILNGAATPEPEVRCGGVTLVKGTDYDLFYENNTVVGKAYLVIVGKGEYAGLTRRQLFLAKSVRFVKLDGTDAASGADWAHAMTLASAVNGLTNGSYDIWCQAGTYDFATIGALTIKNYTTIRGGFAADPADTFKKDPSGAKTVFDGGDTATRLFASGYDCDASLFSSRPIAFEDCAFTRCKGNAIYSTGKATPFTFTRCDFLDNTPQNASVNNDAFVFYCASASSAPVVFKDCHFENNTNNTKYSKSLMYLNVVKLTMDGCTFVKNGAPLSKTRSTYDNSTSSRLIHLGSCSGESKISNCDFRGNFFVRYTVAMQGLYIYSSKTTIENCRFVGNSFWANGYPTKTPISAVISIEAGSASTPVAIRNCTFAYNALDTATDGGTCVYSTGASPTAIESCIFWNNVQDASNPYKRDFQGSNATLTYSLFAELETSGACVSIAPGEGCITDDPLFVTANPIEDYLVSGITSLDPAKIDEILAIDVHLLSPEGYRKNGDATWYKTENELSPAIDAGDPEADFSNEPGKNGERLNMGAYGNTDEASQTPYANPALADPTVAFEGPYTQPTVTLTMGGDGQFNVTVTVLASADGVNWTSSANFSMANGDSVSWLVPEYFPESGKVYLKTSYDFQGATIEDESYEPTNVEGTLPPWYGKGGDPAKVVHVRADATGRGDGTSWTDACTDMGQAMRALTSTRNEMWIAGTAAMVEADNNTTWDKNYTMFFRGGFTGVENAPEQRTDQLATSTITGCGVNDGLKFKSASAKVFENIVFEGGSIYGLKLENGRAAFTNCVFRGNGTSPTLAGYQGRVLNATAVSPLQMQGCVFAENLVTNQWTTPGGKQGHLFSFANTDVYLDDCLFVSNGLKKSIFVWTNNFAAAQGGQKSCPGFLIGFEGNYKSFVANNTRFVANTSIGGDNSSGGVIAFESTGTRVALTNCLFLANELVINPLGSASSGDPGDFIFFGNSQNQTSTSPTTDVVNCTFAFNSTYRANGGAALTVKATGSPVTRVKNSIFLANRTSNGCGWRQLEITTGTAEVDYCCFDTTNGFHGVGYDAVTNAANHNLVAVDPMTYSTVTDFTNALSTVYSIHFDWDHPEKFMNFNMHLRGRGGYIDETTGQKVVGEGKPSPCVDAGDPKSDYRRETKPRGYRVNMGFYGNTPYQTQSGGGGALIIR